MQDVLFDLGLPAVLFLLGDFARSKLVSHVGPLLKRHAQLGCMIGGVVYGKLTIRSRNKAILAFQAEQHFKNIACAL